MFIDKILGPIKQWDIWLKTLTMRWNVGLSS